MGGSQFQALQDVSLSIEPGQIVALMGPSGSGKSTLLNLIGGLDLPTAGTVQVYDFHLEKLSRAQLATYRNECIGFIFQNFNLIPVLTALENVMLSAQLAINSPSLTSLVKRASELLDQVGLGPQKHQSTNKLSGGQMQRVAIARALMNHPRIILADEPTANLDHKTAANVLSLLMEIAKSNSITVVVATHDLAVLKYVQRTVRMEDGKILRDEIH